MSRKLRRLVADYLVYLVVRSVVCVLQCLSIESAYAFANGLAYLAYGIDKRHRKIALENLSIAFGDRYSEDERRRIVLDVYKHFCQVVVEIAFIPRRLRTYTWRKYATMTAPAESIDLVVQDRPKIVVTGHFGNWEMAGYLLAVIGIHPASIARDLDNRFLHDFILRFRSWSGQRILSKKGDFDKIEQTLIDRGCLVSVGDQSAGERGCFVDFFGRPASTHKAIALLSREHAAPIVVGFAYRDRPGFHYNVSTGLPIDPMEFREGEDLRGITAEFTKQLERAVRIAPEQYLWLHNRWKHQPPAPRVKRIKQAA
ncbi:lipid A biosynthesis acyltransferase [bacterium]|nr:lipid A biosynthesis acyltransferase [bacterium]